jgi:hypothetical protein
MCWPACTREIELTRNCWMCLGLNGMKGYDQENKFVELLSHKFLPVFWTNEVISWQNVGESWIRSQSHKTTTSIRHQIQQQMKQNSRESNRMYKNKKTHPYHRYVWIVIKSVLCKWSKYLFENNFSVDFIYLPQWIFIICCYNNALK